MLPLLSRRDGPIEMLSLIERINRAYPSSTEALPSKEKARLPVRYSCCGTGVITGVDSWVVCWLHIVEFALAFAPMRAIH